MSSPAKTQPPAPISESDKLACAKRLHDRREQELREAVAAGMLPHVAEDELAPLKAIVSDYARTSAYDSPRLAVRLARVRREHESNQPILTMDVSVAIPDQDQPRTVELVLPIGRFSAGMLLRELRNYIAEINADEQRLVDEASAREKDLAA